MNWFVVMAVFGWFYGLFSISGAIATSMTSTRWAAFFRISVFISIVLVALGLGGILL